MNTPSPSVPCPHCRAKVLTTAPPEKQVRCPKCKKVFRQAPATVVAPANKTACSSCQTKLKGIKPGTKFKCPKCGSIERAAPASEPSTAVAKPKGPTPKTTVKPLAVRTSEPTPIKPMSKTKRDAEDEEFEVSDEASREPEPVRTPNPKPTPGEASSASSSKRSRARSDDEESGPRISKNLLATLFILVVIGLIIGAWSLFGGDSGSNRAAISGEVTIDGVPVSMGTIHFNALDPKAKIVAVPTARIENGKYSIPREPGPIVGMCKVVIRVERKVGQKAKIMGAPGEMVDEIIEGAAARFNEQSELTFDAKAGSNTANFEVSAR